MKRILIICLLLTLPMAVKADATAELLEVMGGKNQMQQMQNQFIGILTRSNPEMAKHQGTIQQWAEKYLTWEEMSAGMTAVYKKHFNDNEIKQLLDFYKTPIGKKSIEKMPILFRDGSEVGLNMAKKYQPELNRMLAFEYPFQGPSRQNFSH